MSKKIKELAKLIKQYDQAYYENNMSLITDAEYDQIKKKYYKLLEESPDQKTNLINTIGSPIINTSKKIKHLYKMLSLQNGYNTQDIINFTNSIAKHNVSDFFCELKIDGLAFAAQYKNGILHTASTRGDGVTGEDITQNILMIHNFPYILKHNFSGEIYGEIYMPKNIFANNTQFSNPRNAASGTIRLLNPLAVQKRKLEYFAYSIKNNTEINTNQLSQEEVISKLKSLGFITNTIYKKTINIEQIINFYNHCVTIRDSLNYEIDGVVIKVNERKFYNQIGSTNKHPKYAIAYKFVAQQQYTQIISVDFQTGRTGVITPIANLKPVNINGVIVKRCTLHNFHEIQINNIHINDFVYIQRSGDVIPKIIGVALNQRPTNIEKIIPPEQCPSCKHETIKENIYLRCTNIDCPSILENKIKLFVSKQGFNIIGFAEKHIRTFIKYKLINNFCDIFQLEQYTEKILSLEGWSNKSLNNLLENIKKSQTISLENFIFALGIHHIGKINATLVANTCQNVSEFIHITAEQLIKIEGLGEKCIESIIKYLSTNNISDLVSYITFQNKIKSIPKYTHTIFDNKHVCITGKLTNLTREQGYNIVQSLGGIPSMAINNKTNILIYTNTNNSKFQKAKTNPLIALLNEAEFMEIVDKSR